MQTFSIARNRNVHEAQRRISVAESDDRDIHITGFSDRLMIGRWICDDQQTWFTEGSLKEKELLGCAFNLFFFEISDINERKSEKIKPKKANKYRFWNRMFHHS